MNGSNNTRSAPPAPLALSHGQHSSPDSPASEYSSGPRAYKNKSYSYDSFSSRPSSADFSDTATLADWRKDSTSSTKSVGSSSRKPPSPTVNAHSYCGRHSKQWLFSGWSVFGRKNSH